MIPPRLHRTTASRRNWRRMNFGLAPSDLRMPISLVRSVTDTSMMFMMPIPATSSAMIPMTKAPSFTPAVDLVEFADHAGGIEVLEVVFLAALDAALPAQHRPRLGDGVVDQLRCPGVHGDVDGTRETVPADHAVGIQERRDRHQPYCRTRS